MAKKRKPELDYAPTFDQLMTQHFGERFETSWNLFSGVFGGYETRRENGKPLTKSQAKVGRTISNALAAARDQLT